MSVKMIRNIINELNSSLAITIKEKNEEMNFFNKTDNGINIQPQTIEYSFYNGKTVSISGISEKIIELYNGDKFFENKSFIRFILDSINNDYNFEEVNNYEERLREYTNEFFINLTKQYAKQKYNQNFLSLFKSINLIADSNYEGKAPKGKILICKEETMENNINFIFKHSDSILISETKLVRKLLEVSDNELYIISNGYEIFGLGEIVNYKDKNSRDFLVVDFIGKNKYKICYIIIEKKKDSKEKIENIAKEVYNFTIVNEMPKLIGGKYNENEFESIFKRIFSVSNTDKVKSIVETAVNQKRGTMLVFCDKAEEEMRDLKEYGIEITATEITKEFFLNITSIDGAVLMDSTGKCYGIGVILDGIAKGAKGNKERGARYNSALKYIAKCTDINNNIKVVIVVISEDGMVDILPEIGNSEEELKEINELIITLKDLFNKKDYKKIIDVSQGYLLSHKNVNDIRLYIYLINSFYFEYKYEEAVLFSNKIIELYHENALIYRNRGILFVRLGEYEKALADYNRAIEIAPNDSGVYNSRGNLYRKLEQYEKAIEDYNKAIELNPNEPNILSNLAKLKIEQENYEEAEILMDRAFKLGFKENQECQIELWFYRYAIYEKWFEEGEKEIAKLIKMGMKSIVWDLDKIYEKAKKLKHKNLKKLMEFKKSITMK